MSAERQTNGLAAYEGLDQHGIGKLRDREAAGEPARLAWVGAPTRLLERRKSQGSVQCNR